MPMISISFRGSSVLSPLYHRGRPFPAIAFLKKLFPENMTVRVLLGLALVIFLFAALSPLTAGTDGFTILKGLFVTEVKGYGMYTPDESSRFQRGSKITVYLEVDGFQNREKGEDYEILLSLDLQVKDGEGNVGIEQKDVVTSDLTVKSPLRDFYFTMNIDLADLAPGNYTLGFIATDRTNQKKAAKDLNLEIY